MTPEEIEEIQKSLNEIKNFLQDSWNKDARDLLVSGCFKALSAVSYALDEDVTQEEINKKIYPRLIQSMGMLACHFGCTLEEALKIGLDN